MLDESKNAEPIMSLIQEKTPEPAAETKKMNIFEMIKAHNPVIGKK